MEIKGTEDEPLPFSEPKQDAILGHLLENDKFFVQCHDRIKPEWFIDASNSRIYKLKSDFYKKYKRCAHLEELKNHSTILSEDIQTRNRLYAKIDLAKHNASIFKLDAITPELTDWLHSRVFFSGVNKSIALYNSGKKDEAFDISRQMVKTISDTTFYQDQEVRFDDYKEFNLRQKSQIEGALTFGNNIVDRLLNPDAPNGALLRGDTTIVLAASNVGKTTTLITIAKHNIVRCNPVLWITHEGTIIDLQTKMWCAMLDVSRAELYAMLENPQSFPKFEEKLKWFNDYLTFLPINKAGMTIEEVETIIRKRQEDRITRCGEGYAMVINDYPAKLTTKRATGGQMAKRTADGIVYDYFVQLALEYNFHSLLAIQTNREGSKVNDQRSGSDSRLVGMEDVSESWEPMTIATNVISINRDTIAEAMNRVTYYICKSRSSMKGWAVVCKSNFAHAITHSNEMGATWYRSKSTMAEKIDSFLEQHKGQEIPKHLLTD